MEKSDKGKLVKVQGLQLLELPLEGWEDSDKSDRVGIVGEMEEEVMGKDN